MICHCLSCGFKSPDVHDFFHHDCRRSIKIPKAWDFLMYVPYVRRILFLWCRLFHRKHHDRYFSDGYGDRVKGDKIYFRCLKCGHGFARYIIQAPRYL
jgi:hypothetical protein